MYKYRISFTANKFSTVHFPIIFETTSVYKLFDNTHFTQTGGKPYILDRFDTAESF